MNHVGVDIISDSKLGNDKIRTDRSRWGRIEIFSNGNSIAIQGGWIES